MLVSQTVIVGCHSTIEFM